MFKQQFQSLNDIPTRKIKFGCKRISGIAAVPSGIRLREALGSSLNVPAVKIATIIGLHETYKVLQSIVLTHLKEPDYFGVSMPLGAVEVRLEDLANAYRIFAKRICFHHFLNSC